MSVLSMSSASQYPSFFSSFFLILMAEPCINMPEKSYTIRVFGMYSEYNISHHTVEVCVISSYYLRIDFFPPNLEFQTFHKTIRAWTDRGRELSVFDQRTESSSALQYFQVISSFQTIFK